jgi:hypothetical protein
MDKVLSDCIAALIAAHRAGLGCHDWQHEMATRFGALGVYGDIGGALMLCPDGTVRSAGWDDEQASEASPASRFIALAAASYRFPELAALAPERPAAARLCSRCGGPGCEWCFGMGWLPDSLA